jgi:tetratricopeptide (TPR) repeat protein
VQTALDFAQSRLKKIPEDLSSRIVICRGWLIQGRIEEARDLLVEIGEILSGLSRLYECMGDLYSKKGLDNEAEIFYRKGRALEPQNPLPLDAERKSDAFEQSPGAGEYHEEIANPEMPPDFETVTLAGLYMRQGHYRMAEEMLVRIINRDGTNDRAARLLEDVRDHLAPMQERPMDEDIIKELSRWLDNMGSLSRNA